MENKKLLYDLHLKVKKQKKEKIYGPLLGKKIISNKRNFLGRETKGSIFVTDLWADKDIK